MHLTLYSELFLCRVDYDPGYLSVYDKVTWYIVHLTEEPSVYKVDALEYAEVTCNIVNLTEEHSLYEVDALVYAEVTWNIIIFSQPNEGTFTV